MSNNVCLSGAFFSCNIQVGLLVVGHACPKLNFQFRNEAGLLELLKLVQKNLPEVDSNQQDSGSQDDQRNVAFQVNILTLNAPMATKVVCFSRLLKCLRSLYGKQCGPRSDCSFRSSLFWVQAQGGFSIFFCIGRLGPSIYPSPQKNIRNFKHPKKIFEIFATPKKYPDSVYLP